ncbi:MAG: mandelate racemase/muconate lactonizing enzyme family protein [Rhodovibrionaceae bacterium]
MKITQVEAIYLSLPEIAQRTDSSQDALLIRIDTDAGITGWGEVDSCPAVVAATVAAPSSHTLVNGLRDLLLGENPLAIGSLWDKMWNATLYFGRYGAVVHAMAGIDLALWDIKGKALDLPVHLLLGGGGRYRSEIRAYASNMMQMTPDATAARAREVVEQGFTAMKFGWEPLGPDAEFDCQLISAIRDAIGPKAELMIDAGLAWDAKTAIQRCRLFEPYNLYWLEEPLGPDDLRGYARLSAAVDTRIAAGEEEATVEGYRRLMDEGRIDVVQVDVTRTGLTQAIRIAEMAHRRGLPCANHTFTTDINVAASLHFLAAIPNAIILEYGVEPSDIARNLAKEPIRIEDGIARVPTAPGLGVEIDEAIVARYRRDPLAGG